MGGQGQGHGQGSVGAQRRAAVRAAMTRLSCTIWLAGEERCAALPAQVENLSADGILLALGQPILPGQTVRCHLSLEGEGERTDRVALWARGVRVGSDGPPFVTAMEFVLNGDAKRDRLHRWVGAHLAQLRQRYGHI